jgi:hypothetical protein
LGLRWTGNGGECIMNSFTAFTSQKKYYLGDQISKAYYTMGGIGSHRILMWKPEGKKSSWKTWK